jgi:hypothetical protein
MDKPTTQSAAAHSAANDTSAEDESFGDLFRRHPIAFIAGGIALGAVAGALLPRGTGRRLTKSAAALAATAGEAGILLSRNARDKAEELGREGREVLGRNAAAAQRHAADLADSAKSTGAKVVDQVVELASKVRP